MEYARETGGCTELVYSSGKSVFIFVNGNDLPPDIWQGTQKFRAFARRHNNNKHRVHRAPRDQDRAGEGESSNAESVARPLEDTIILRIPDITSAAGNRRRVKERRE